MRLFNFENNKVENKRKTFAFALTAKHLTRSAAVQSNGHLSVHLHFFRCFSQLWCRLKDDLLGVCPVSKSPSYADANTATPHTHAAGQKQNFGKYQ